MITSLFRIIGNYNTVILDQFLFSKEAFCVEFFISTERADQFFEKNARTSGKKTKHSFFYSYYYSYSKRMSKKRPCVLN